MCIIFSVFFIVYNYSVIYFKPVNFFLLVGENRGSKLDKVGTLAYKTVLRENIEKIAKLLTANKKNSRTEP